MLMLANTHSPLAGAVTEYRQCSRSWIYG